MEATTRAATKTTPTQGKTSDLPQLQVIPLGAIEVDPDNPRSRPSPEMVAGLKAALGTDGAYQQPPTVYPVGGGRYRVEHGNTRVLAAQGVVTQLPVLIVDAPASRAAKLAGQLSVNILQDSLNPIDIGLGLAALQREEELSLRGIVEKLKERGVIRSRAWVQMHLELAKLPLGMQELVRRGELGARHAWMLRGFAPDVQSEMAARAREASWSVERLAHELGLPGAVDAPGGSDAAQWTQREVDERIATAADQWSKGQKSARALTPTSARPGPVSSHWTLLPVEAPDAMPSQRINNARWAKRATDEERQLAIEAKRSGYDDGTAIALVERARQEADGQPNPEVRELLNALRKAEEHAEDFADYPALSEFAALRMKNWLSRVGHQRRRTRRV